MALLRMLAFRPQGVAPTAAPPPVTRTAAARNASAPATRHGAVAPERTLERTPERAPPVANDWDAIVAALGLQGTARHFAANCVLLERKSGVVYLRLDPAGESFRRPQIETRLAEALAQYFGEPLRLEITQAGAPGEILTPAKRDAIAADDRQRAAEAAIDSDPAVRAMRDVFGATVRPGSVKPLG
jgi:DNA polymerase-3 subunit gamma/tau